MLAVVTYVAVRSGNRARRVVATVFGVLAFGVCLILTFAARDMWWLWAASFASPALIAFHGLHVAVFKNRGFLEDRGRSRGADEANLRPLIQAASQQEEQYYASAALTLRYGLPALLLAGAALTVGYALLKPHTFFIQLDPGSTNLATGFGAAKYGAMGAYLYILLNLGSRTFRSDVTTGAALWATVTMASGPILAGALAVLFSGGPKGEWTTGLLPFAAGFSPRYISAFLEAAIRRAFGSSEQGSPRTVPLMQVRGITRDIEERLAEEGITDVAALAMANPLRLRRNTSFDRRQLTAWVDEALLITFVPQGAQSLIADGVTGAIDLIWYASPKKEPAEGAGESRDEAPSETTGPDPAQVPEAVTKLAERNKLDASALWETILRLREDAQVRLVWATYQLADSDGEAEAATDSFGSFRAENLALSNKLKLSGADASSEWQERRKAVYARTNRLFIVDTWRPSTQHGQVADIVLRLFEHERGLLAEGRVKSVEYFLGSKFFKAPITKSDATTSFSLSVSAYGPFLCIAQVSFNDGSPPMDLERYVYFPT
jgi:hypothetical protein